MLAWIRYPSVILQEPRDPSQTRRTGPQDRPGSGDRAAPDGEETFQGTIETITYHDDSSLFGVLRLDPDPGFQAPEDGSLFSPGRVTAIGKIADPVEGARVRLSDWTNHEEL